MPLRPKGSPVFKFRGYFGNAEDEISTLIWWPTLNIWQPINIVLYQKNIEAVCSSETEVREQIRLTVMHELGHYFGLDENQLKDV